MPRISQSVAMGVGVAGALVDVTSDVNLDEGVSRSWGRDDEFRDTVPGTFAFTLDNGTGKYTPGNTAGGLSTLVTEGMQVCWQLGTRLVAGTIRGIEPVFPSDEAGWAQVRITCDDMLGSLARNQITNSLAQAMVSGSSPYLYWPLNDAVSSAAAVPTVGVAPSIAPSVTFPATLTFGQTGVSGVGDTQLLVSSPLGSGSGGAQAINSPALSFPTISYTPGQIGSWGFWFTPLVQSAASQEYFNLTVTLTNGLKFGWGAGTTTAILGGGSVINLVTYAYTAGPTPTPVAVPVPGVPLYLSATLTASSTQVTLKFYINGVLVSSSGGGGITTTLPPNTNANNRPQAVSITQSNDGSTLATSFLLSHLSHTGAPVFESQITAGTEASLIAAAVGTTLEATLGTLPTNLSTASVSFNSLAGSSALDALNAVIKTEQGYVYTATTGTLTSPTQVVKVRERTRNASVDYTFDTILDLKGAIPYVRDITNMVSTLTTSGPSVTLVLQDPTVVPRVGSASTSESILNNSPVDILAWGQDRLNRGKNAALRVSNVTVDAMTTTTDRSAALLAMLPGDHFQITSNPTTQLGFAAWDGWLIGADEHHTTTEHTFAMRFAPVLAPTAVYDTDLYANGGNNTISTTLTAGATSMLCVSADGISFFEQSAVGYTLQLESEQVTVTACSAPVANIQTLTITRGVNSTTAAGHAIGVVPEVVTPSIYAF